MTSMSKSPRPNMQRSTSKTFLSNEVLYGDRSATPTESQFITEAKLMQQRAANQPVKIDGQPERYAKGIKPRPPTMSGILGSESSVKEIRP